MPALGPVRAGDGEPSDEPTPSVRRLAAAARAYAAAKDSANTARAYASDWRLFGGWCRRQGLAPERPDPQVVGLYLTALAAGDGVDPCAVATIERKLSAIAAAYRAAGHRLERQDRHIAAVMAGIRRSHGRPPRQKEAVLGDDLLAMLATLANDLRGWRDRAILLVGFAGGLRRSEIVGLDCGPGQSEDGGGWLEILPGGALLTIRGKTGWRTVEVARGSSARTCPVAALETWLTLARVAHGPIFRRLREPNGAVAAERLCDKHVARLVARSALAAGVRGRPARRRAPPRLRRALAARRPRQRGRGRGGPDAAPARPRLGRDDAPLQAPARTLPGQPHQSRRALIAAPPSPQRQELQAAAVDASR